MAVLYLSLASFNLDLHAPLRQVSFRSMQFMLISLQSEEASTYSIFVKCNLDAPLPWMPGPSLRLHSRPLCTPLVCRELGKNYGISF